MASDGVRLVERLRLGERPLEADWRLASSILQLRDAASGLLDAATDLIDDKEKARKRLRFQVRVELLALAVERLEAVVAALSEDLNSYFDLRAEEDEGDHGELHEEGDRASNPEAPVEAIRNEITVVLEAGGIYESDAKALGDTLETMRLDCAWLMEGLTRFVESDADIDRTLDFCGDIEARFSPGMFEVVDQGILAPALRNAMDRVSSDT